MRTPATSVSNERSYSPAKCDTSVEVPPMSKPITLSKPARWRSPPCRRRRRPGPTGWRRGRGTARADFRPPDDAMNSSCTACVELPLYPPSPWRASSAGRGGGLRGGCPRLEAVHHPDPGPPPSRGREKTERARDLVDVAAQDRRQVGVGDGGVAAADDLDQRRHLVAGRHLRKAERSRQLRRRRSCSG